MSTPRPQEDAARGLETPACAHRLRMGGLALAGLTLLVLSVYSIPFSPPESPPAIPPELAPRFAEAHRFIWPKIIAGWGRLAMELTAIWLVVTSMAAVRVEIRYGHDRLRRWPARILFLTAVWLFFYVVGLPISLRSFLHSREFGLTPLTVPGYLRILALGIPVSLAIYLLKFLLIYCFMAVFRSRWWLASALLVFLVFQLIPEKVSRTMPVDPVHSFEPLTEGPYHDAMAEVAARAGEEITLLVEDRSNRSRSVNMYMTGRVGREYAVVTDTLLERLTPDEVAAVFAHELGHKITRPITIPLNMAIGVGKMLLIFYLVHLLYRRRAIPDTSRLQALMYILLSIQLVSQVVSPFSHAVYRYQERTSDAYSLSLTRRPDALRGALFQVGAANLEPYQVPGWVYFTSASHPLLRDRVAMADAFVAEPE